MATETYNKNDFEEAYFVRDNVRTLLRTIYCKFGTDLPQVWWSSDKIMEVEFTYVTDFWGGNEKTETWYVTENTTWAEICESDKVRFFDVNGNMAFTPSSITIEKKDVKEGTGANFEDTYQMTLEEFLKANNIDYVDNGATITYATDRISYWILCNGNEINVNDKFVKGAAYTLIPRVKDVGINEIPIQKVDLGNNEIEIEETTIALFAVKENGKYRITAESENAFISYMLNESDEEESIETNELEIDLKKYDSLKIMCSTQDFESDTYNLRIEKIE